MSIIAAKSWLPPELTTVQPYSMSPVLGCDVSENRAFCAGMWVKPAVGTCVGMDRPELMISSCFVAPMHVQREAQRAGRRGIVMSYPAGLLEAVYGPTLGEPVPVVRAETPAAAILKSQSFVDQLAALDEDD